MALTRRFDEAFCYAHPLHRTHTRKGTPVPYISHLMAVAALVIEHGGDEGSPAPAVAEEGHAPVFRVEPRRKPRRADEIAEHHRERPPLGVGAPRGCFRAATLSGRLTTAWRSATSPPTTTPTTTRSLRFGGAFSRRSRGCSSACCCSREMGVFFDTDQTDLSGTAQTTVDKQAA